MCKKLPSTGHNSYRQTLTTDTVLLRENTSLVIKLGTELRRRFEISTDNVLQALRRRDIMGTA